jgi:vanillate O-demethylase monooxygenase subunit
MFAKDCWYVAARPEELGEGLLKRTIAGEDLVMYRAASGAPVAFLDRCPHRLAPLSLGRRVGDDLECGYHGVRFAPGGQCVRIPGEDAVPGHFRARGFPLLEKWGFLWVWLGDAARADPALLPGDFHWQGEPGWCPLSGYVQVRAHYQLLVDNLLDLSHEAFLHMNTIGNTAVAETPARTTLQGDTVEVLREMPGCTPPRLFSRAAGFAGPIDRYQRILFAPPCFVIIEVKACLAGTGDYENGLVWWVLNALTPETEGSTHYFWGLPRHFKQDDAELTGMLAEGIARTFNEDKDMLEAQQRILEKVPLETRTVYIRADQAPSRARSIVAAQIERERMAAAHAPAVSVALDPVR